MSFLHDIAVLHFLVSAVFRVTILSEQVSLAIWRLHQLQNQTELLATSAEQAAFFLDTALAARRSNQTPRDKAARRNSHFLFTLHLKQERREKSNKAARECLLWLFKMPDRMSF